MMVALVPMFAAGALLGLLGFRVLVLLPAVGLVLAIELYAGAGLFQALTSIAAVEFGYLAGAIAAQWWAER